MPKYTTCKFLSANETHWDPNAIASEQTESRLGLHQKTTIRFNVDLRSTLTISQYNNEMRQVGCVIFKDIDIDHLLEYFQEVKQHLAEQELVNKLMGGK